MKRRFVGIILSFLLVCVSCPVGAKKQTQESQVQEEQVQEEEEFLENSLKAIQEEALGAALENPEALLGMVEEALSSEKVSQEQKELIQEVAASQNLPLYGEELLEIEKLWEQIDKIRNDPQFQELLAYAADHEEVQILAKALMEEMVKFAQEDWATTREVLATLGLQEETLIVLDHVQENSSLYSIFLKKYFETKQGKAFLANMVLLTGDKQVDTFLLDLLDQLANKNQEMVK